MATRSWRSLLLKAGAGFVLVLALLFACLHLPPVRARVLAAALGALAPYGVQGKAQGLDYNVLTLTARVTDLSLAAEGRGDAPFFEAGEVEIDLPWSAAWRGLAIESLTIVRPRLRIARLSDGLLNLPSLPPGEDPLAGETQPAKATAIAIGRVEIRDLGASFADAPASLDVEVSGVELLLAPRQDGGTSGTLALEGSGRLRWGDRETRLQAVESRLAFDGTRVSLEATRLALDEGELRLSGRIGVLEAVPNVDLGYEGLVDLMRAAAWAGPPVPIEGSIGFSGKVTGQLGDPIVSMALVADDLVLSGIRDASIRTSLRLSRSEAVLESLELDAAGGRLTGEGRVSLATGDMPGSLAVSWRDMDAGALIAAASPSSAVIPQSRLTGNLEGQWTALRPDSIRLSVENVARSARVSAGAPGLDGSMSLDARNARWTFDASHRLGAALEIVAALKGQLAPDILDTTVGGRVTGRSPDLGEAYRTAAAMGVAEPLPADFSLGGDGEVNLDVSGTLGAPRLTGTLEADGLGFKDIGPASLEARFSATTREVRLERLEAREGANRAGASGSISLETRRIAGSASLEVADVARFAALAPTVLSPSGSVVITAELSGDTTNPRVDALMNGSRLSLAGQPFDSLSAVLGLEGQVANASRVELVQGEGRLVASGRYSLEGGTFDVTASGRGLRLHDVPPAAEGEAPIALGGVFDLDIEGAGSPDDPTGSLTLRAPAVSAAGFDVGAVRADVEAAGRKLLFTSTIDELGTTVGGSLELGAPALFTLKANVDDADLGAALARMGRPLERPVSGTLSLGMEASGDLERLPEADVTLDFRRLEAALDSVPVRLAGPAQIVYRGGDRAIDAAGLAIALGKTHLTVAGSLGRDPSTSLVVKLDGDASDLASLLAFVPGGEGSALGSLRAAGTLAVEARIGGPIDRPFVLAGVAIDGGRIETGDVPPVTDIVLNARYRDGVVELQQVGAGWQKASLTASGRLPARLLAAYLPAAYVDSLPDSPGRATLEARLSSLGENALAPFVANETLEQLSGVLEASLDVSAEALSAESATGTLTLTRAALAMGGVSLEQRRPTRFELAGGRLRVADFDWGGPTSDLVLGGEVILADDTSLDLAAKGRFDLRLLGAFVRDVRTGGEAAVQLRLHGAGSDPALDGEVRLSGVEMRVSEPRLVVADLGGTIALSHDGLEASGISGTANGGTLRIDGDLRYPGFALEGGSLSIAGRKVALALEGLRAEVDADLALGLSPDEAMVSGTVTVVRGAYREPLTLSSGLLAALRQQGQATAREPSSADAIRLDVQLRTGEDLLVDNNYARLGMDADLRLVGTLGQPALAGRASVGEGGQIFLGGNVYRIVGPGSVDFANPTRIEPDLNVSALTRVGRYDITLSIKGTPDRLETELTSDDPMLGQSDLVSLLLTGRTVEEAGGDQGAVARDQLLGLLSGEFLGSAGRAVGLDTVRLERGSQDLQFDAGLVASETDPGSRLTFGERVGRDVHLVFSQSLAESGGFTWIAGYNVWRSLLLRVVSLDNGDRSYELRHDVSFGSARTREVAPVPEAARVAEVRFLGEPRFDDRQLLGRLDLSPGDRFDFFEWQRDRDRLEEFYHSRGYREVRIDAARSEDEGGPRGRRVRLDYDIHTGPLARLELEGFDLPPSVVGRMERAWGRSILDEFLLEEMRSIAREHLSRAGYLRAAIDASVVPPTSPGEKTIVVRIEPGPRTSDRRIVFRGNEHLSDSRLASHVAAHGLDEAAWVRPRELSSSLRSLYAREGMLAAEVEVLDVEFVGDGAALPVGIVEGPVFQVGEVALEGVRALSEEEVRAALGVVSGDVYSAERVQEARRRVDQGYRAKGFNEVTVTAETAAETTTGLVRVSVTVDEGVRQVLAEVVTTGATRTSPSLLARALKFEPGAPVSLGDWYRARKRLYDTGAFRRVDIEMEPLGEVSVDASGIGIAPVLARVTLEEVPLLRFRYGLQLNDAHDPLHDTRAFTPGFAADLTARNLFGRATATGVATRVTSDFRAGRAFLTSPTSFGLPVVSNVFLSRSREDLAEESSSPYIVDRTTLTMEQRLRPAGNVQVGYGFSFERNHTFDVNPLPDDPFAFDLTVDVAKLRGTSLFDSRNDLVDPSAGWFVSSNFEYGIGAFGSDLQFVKYLLQQRYYRHVGRGVVVATAASLGLSRGFGQEIIPSERFFAGGGNSVRGYATDALGPLDFFGDPRGGEALLVLNEEVRFPIAWILRGVAFFDAGNAFSSIGDMSLFDLRSSAGLGLRAQTPVALLRVDFGVPLGRRPGEARGRWFFSIGQAF